MMAEAAPLLETDPLAAFLPPVRAWFEQTLGAPTPPQLQGWPPIQRGEQSLILAPTGSGKTLAAFLWAIDQIFRELLRFGDSPEGGRKKKPPAEIYLLYISPLKALNNDVERNLRRPLEGIRATAAAMGMELPEIKVAVRSGDTPQRERQALVRTPPHILITTPESLYLLLTSPKARQRLASVRTVILDEIHTLAGSKRGVHLSLSLERLHHLANHPIQRIGLSATIQPLAEVARYLGGSEWVGHGADRRLIPRPVTIVDAAYHKGLDLLVESVVEDFRNLPGDSIWPSLIPQVVARMQAHTSTLIFVNNRRQAERTADRINEQLAAAAQGDPTGLLADGVAKGQGIFGAGRGDHAQPIRAHHGSISKESRLALETDLKAGRLPALVGTSSLELGIDIGAVDLVLQIQSPKAVSQGLQRVGRSGHLVGQTSKGRIFPTHREDVMEAAAIAGGMLRGEVEPTRTPRNALDVLAQQVVALVSVQDWAEDALYDLVRQAYPYTDLTERAFHGVLQMLSGRYPSLTHQSLRPRLSWDRVNNRLAALPGARLLATTNGGTISDRGAFGAYLSDGKTKLGELDEEFVYETRVGDILMLGSQVWRVIDITDDKLLVADAAGATPRMPFWRGDFPWRPYDLGQRVGAFRRAVADRLTRVKDSLNLESHRALMGRREDAQVQAVVTWLGLEYALDGNSAGLVMDYVAGQLDHSGVISSDRTVLVEIFEDALGDPRMVIQAPFGGRVNGLWGLALAAALRQRTGVDAELQTNDDGILMRFPEADAAFPLDLVTEMTPAAARELILQELPNSAVFGAQFRQNAARALLLPGLRGGKRTPFWLQRLRAKDLLQAVSHFDDFPIIAETYRDCLEEVMDLPHLEEVLTAIQSGEIAVTVMESLNPSPVAHSLMWDFVEFYMYEWDTPKAERQLQNLSLNRDLLQDLLQDVDLADLLRPEAVTAVHGSLQRTAPTAQVRTAEELAALFLSLGDLSSVEVAQRATVDPSGWIGQLAGAQRIVSLSIPTARGLVSRWVHAEYASEYATAFDLKGLSAVDHPLAQDGESARQRILDRYLGQSGPLTQEMILARYAFPPDWLQAQLQEWVADRRLAHGHFTPRVASAEAPGPDLAEYVDREALEQMHRRTLAILRREVRPVPLPVYVDFLTRWQHLHPQTRLTGDGALRLALQQLRAAPIVGVTWERDILPLRVEGFQSQELAALCASGELAWVGCGGVDPRRGRVRFLFRGEGAIYLEAPPESLVDLSPHAQAVYTFLKNEGALFATDIQSALDLSVGEVEQALVTLAMAGLVTNDSLAVLQHLLETGAPMQSATAPRPASPLEAQLAQRLGPLRARGPATFGGFQRPSRGDLREAKKRVRQRLEQSASMVPVDAMKEGRWTLVHRYGLLGKAPAPAQQIAAQTRQLLARYGVVTRDSLTNEVGAWDWGLIYAELQRLEMRGEVRRGLFVEGLPGLQFALPEVVEGLRALGAQSPISEQESLVLINACDPANLYGSALAGAPQAFDGAPLTFTRTPSIWLVLHRGLPVLLIEGGGARLTAGLGVDDGLLGRSLQTWLDHVRNFSRRVEVQQWNGESVLGSPVQPLLEAIGFYRAYPAMVWEADS